jgi:hypothetical protein
MPTHGLLVEELSQIISQATAPAFLLAGVAAFISILIGRLNRILDRGRELSANEDNDSSTRQLRMDTSGLRLRAKLLSKALEYAIVSAVFITLLVITAFASAAVGLNQVYGAAILFVLALGFFGVSLICFWSEVRIAAKDVAEIP